MPYQVIDLISIWSLSEASCSSPSPFAEKGTVAMIDYKIILLLEGLVALIIGIYLINHDLHGQD